ncbi:MAG: hypothetical protein ACTHL1_07020 [Burkholderiaceae bacterium]
MALLILPVILPAAALAQAVAAPPAPDAAATAFFANAVTLRGTLGGAEMQATLRPKTDEAEGLEGDYFLFGHSAKVLLAGEIDADGVFLEESENGKDVSGQWEGTVRDGAFSGTWTSADGGVVKPFSLRPVAGAVPAR